MAAIRSVPPRAITAALLTAVLVGALAACSLDAGTEAGDRFEAELAQVEDVASVASSGNNTLPFTGDASARVELEPATTDARVGEIVDVVGAYMNKHSGARVKWTPVTVATDGFELEVTDTRATNDQQMRLFTAVRHDPAFAGATLSVADAFDTGGSLELTAADGTTFVEALRVGRALAAAVPLYADAAVGATSADDQLTVSTRREDGPAGDPSGAIAAYAAVSAQFAVTAAELSPDGATLRIERDSDTPAATALAEGAPGASGLALAVNGGGVTRSGDGDFAATDDLLAATATLPGVLDIIAGPEAINFFVADLEAAGVVVSALVEAPPTPTPLLLTISGPEHDAFNRDFTLTARPADLEDALELVRDTAAFGPLQIAPGAREPLASFTLRAADRAGLTTLLYLVKPRLATGTSVTLTLTRDDELSSRVSFEAARTIVVEGYPDTDTPADTAARELVTQVWNDAPAK